MTGIPSYSFSLYDRSYNKISEETLQKQVNERAKDSIMIIGDKIVIKEMTVEGKCYLNLMKLIKETGKYQPTVDSKLVRCSDVLSQNEEILIH